MSETVEGLSKHSWDTNPLFCQDEVYERMRLPSESAPAALSNNSHCWELGAQFMRVPELWRKQPWTSSCICCWTVTLYFIILLPWDFTGRLRSPGGAFWLMLTWFLGFPFLQHHRAFLLGFHGSFHITSSATSECYSITQTLTLLPPLFPSYSVIFETF